jgi:hypothetical protein
MKNLVLITSVINTPTTPLSYTQTRSVYTKEERFEQTKRTIATVKEKIPDSAIFLIECSQIDHEVQEYFRQHTDIFVNLFDTGNETIIQNVFSKSKALGEGTMTICANKFLQENNIQYDNLFKISGRYSLTDRFDYEKFNNDKIVIKYIANDITNCNTSLYKLPRPVYKEFVEFLLNNEKLMHDCMGYECIFALFLKNRENINIIDPIGVCGHIAVGPDYCDT